MPRFFSLGAAFLLLQLALEVPGLVAEPEPVGLVLVLGIAWLFTLRWVARREGWPFEARPAGFFFLPLALYWAFLALFGGARLLEQWELPAILGSWIGLVPFFVIQFGFRYGEGVLLGLGKDEAGEFATRQTLSMLALVAPVAVLAQAWESATSWLPEDPATWGAGDQAIAFVAEVVLPLGLFLALAAALPWLLGAGRGMPEWQERVDRLWRGRGRVPRVRHWPTQGLLANAMALGVGRWRAVLLSDRLLDRLQEHELEAVVAHELAHLHRRHGFTLLAGMFGAVLTAHAALVWILQPPADEELAFGWQLVAVLLGAIPLVLARRTFEMEADLDAIGSTPYAGMGLVGALTSLSHGSSRWGIYYLPTPRRVAEIERCGADAAHAEAWRRRANRARGTLWALFVVGFGAAALGSWTVDGS